MSNITDPVVYGPILAGSICLIVGIFYFKSKSNSKSKKFHFPDSNNALSEAKKIISDTVPVSREEIKSAITNSNLTHIKGGSRKHFKKVGKKKTRGQSKR